MWGFAGPGENWGKLTDRRSKDTVGTVQMMLQLAQGPRQDISPLWGVGHPNRNKHWHESFWDWQLWQMEEEEEEKAWGDVVWEAA